MRLWRNLTLDQIALGIGIVLNKALHTNCIEQQIAKL